MIELFAVATPTHQVVEQVMVIEEVGRIVSFRLPPGAGVPETRTAPLLIVASTDLALQVDSVSDGMALIALEAGQTQFMPLGVSGIINTGANEARFTLIDLPAAE